MLGFIAIFVLITVLYVVVYAIGVSIWGNKAFVPIAYGAVCGAIITTLLHTLL